MAMDDIARSLRLIERAKYQYSLGQDPEAKKAGLEAINILNQVLKSDPNNKALVKEICQNALSVYEGIASKNLFKFNDKLLWLGSSVNKGFFPPIDDNFSRLIESEELFDELHLSEEQQGRLVGWESVDGTSEWSTDGADHWFQDYLQDCSFVASLISLSKSNSQDILNIITPHNTSKRYGVTLHFNGCKRLVEIGNQLPKLEGDCLYIKSWSNEKLLWAALIEKAYLKIQGHGYEAKGSNASIDTYIISGWIPEFIHVDQRVNLGDIWDEIEEHFGRNELVLSLGTGEYTEEFHPNHDYSVLELVKDSGYVIMKNPWERTITSIKFEEIFDHFETLYINWNPSSFIHKTLNFISAFNDGVFSNNPQFAVQNTSSKKSKVWVLIEKHLGFEKSSLNTLIFQSEGEKFFQKGKALVYNSANDSGFHLSKFELGPGQSATVVVTNDSKQTQNFTIHTYSTQEVALKKPKSLLPFSKSIESQWDVESCGGNWTNQSYVQNPQYEINIPKGPKDEVNMIFGLYSERDVLVNLQLYFVDVKPFSGKPSIINEKYQAGSLVHSTSLKSGLKYKLVLSTYDPDVLAPFKLVVNSESDFTLDKIITRLGLFVKTYKFGWNNKNRFKFRFKAERQINARIHIWTDNSYSTYRPKIRASLFYSDGRPIQINTEFDDSLFGIWLQELVINGDDSVILLVERFEVGNDVETFIQLGTDQRVEILTQ